MRYIKRLAVSSITTIARILLLDQTELKVHLISFGDQWSIVSQSLKEGLEAL